MAFTAKMEMFCNEYLLDLNGTQAAIRSGYSEQTSYSIANENLNKPEIKARIAELNKERLEKVKDNQSVVIEDILRNATTDIKDFIDIDEGGGIKTKTFAQMPKYASRSIKKIKSKRIIRESADGKQMIIDDNFEFELHSKEKAQEMLGRHLNLFSDTININSPIPVVIMSQEGKPIENLSSRATDTPTP